MYSLKTAAIANVLMALIVFSVLFFIEKDMLISFIETFIFGMFVEVFFFTYMVGVIFNKNFRKYDFPLNELFESGKPFKTLGILSIVLF
uniref:hypothetical protein n=1 Tax=Providencia alcalifaciens TaxID=126385 RepID=UPI002B06050C